MNEPLWIEQSEVMLIHQQMIDRYGGSHGVRDHSLLESALAGPRNHFAYGETDLFILAVNYVNGICLNHPFIDGNKRTGFTVGMVFLEINGVSVSAESQVAADNVIGLIQRTVTVESFADWLRDNSK